MRLQIRMHVSWNGNGNVERIENTLQWWAEHAAVVHPQSPCAMGVMAINSYNNNWSHDSDSLLEMTPVVSGPRMLMYGLTHPKQPLHRKGVPNDLPTEKEADIRVQIDPMKEVLHCGTVEPGLCGRNKRG